ncbi:MAG: glycosyl hydrolase [Armatimonadetes bacterium]|nr:glycosyl hydrolase [Armatimonadota bacterium]
MLAGSSLSFGQSPDQYKGLEWRFAGPFRGGRSLAVAGSPQRPKEYYFGATGGGIWKTTDGGDNWLPVSDGFLGSSSVGAIAIAPSNPDVIYAGTGERDIRGDISEGDGIYKSSDGGKTWSHIGLEATRTISRIVVDPKDPNTVWVAALGHVYGKSTERGIYKSTDGGATWHHVFFSTDHTGAVDLVIDPNHPNILLASFWDAWRTPYSLNSGGPNSGMYKSEDGGDTWTDISRNEGLPKDTLGKIGLSISPVDSNRYWAIVEAQDGGLFCSDDAGKTWRKVNEDRNWRQRAWYYTHVYADPKDKETVYVLNVGWGRSSNGGKTFSNLRPPHGDNHDLWIAPDDPQRMIEANDGGATITADGGKTFSALEMPTAQFYHVSADNAFPYNILGAQQDNSTVRIASRTFGRGITKDDWTSTAGGESGYVTPKPDDPDIVFGGSYGGDLSWYNHRTKVSRAIDPWPDNPMGHGAEDLDYRFQWTYPIVFSPNDPNLIYTCSQYVMTSHDMGQSWKKISPDLTRNDKSTLGSSGGPITKDNTSVEYYGTVFTVAESPKRRGVIWAGSDDGLIHVTMDGGKHWTDVTPLQMPKWGLVSMIDPSPFDAGTAYAAVDNHESDDYQPYAYKTTDYGKTWTPITTGIPKDTFVRVVREDHKQKNLLYAGTENGVYVSFNGGSSWQSLQNNLPVTPVHDLIWKDNDLVIATHGRGFWILDDISSLQQLAQKGDNVTRLFTPRDAYPVSYGGRGDSKSGMNPPSGLVIDCYLAQPVKSLKFQITDPKGNVVQTVESGASEAGFHRTSTFLRYRSFSMPGGMILWSGFPSPITAPPGTYKLTMTADGQTFSTDFRWSKDPRTTASDADLQEKFRFQMEIVAKIDQAHKALADIKKTKEERGDKADPKWLADITAVEEAIYQTKNKSGQDPLNYPIRLNDKLAGVFSNVSGGNFRPTSQSYEVFKMLSKKLDEQLAKLAVLLKQK